MHVYKYVVILTVLTFFYILVYNAPYILLKMYTFISSFDGFD